MTQDPDLAEDLAEILAETVQSTTNALAGLGAAFTNLASTFSTASISMAATATSMSAIWEEMMQNIYYAVDSPLTIAGPGVHTPTSGIATPRVREVMNIPTHGLVYVEQFKFGIEGNPTLYGGTWINEWAQDGEWLAPGIRL